MEFPELRIEKLSPGIANILLRLINCRSKDIREPKAARANGRTGGATTFGAGGVAKIRINSTSYL
jgi:hypothetical protein